jgi:hypothetical protein
MESTLSFKLKNLNVLSHYTRVEFVTNTKAEMETLEIFLHLGPDRPWSPPSLLYNEYRVFPGSKEVGAWL